MSHDRKPPGIQERDDAIQEWAKIARGLRAQLAASEAGAAAMREQVQATLRASWKCSDACNANTEDAWCVCWRDELRQALASDAGKELLQRAENAYADIADAYRVAYAAGFATAKKKAAKVAETEEAYPSDWPSKKLSEYAAMIEYGDADVQTFVRAGVKEATRSIAAAIRALKSSDPDD